MSLDQWIANNTGAVLGTNPSDNGECLGLANCHTRDVLGIPLYPIQGVMYAKDYLEGNNKRPDLLEIIYNDPNNPNQLPQKGDQLVFGGGFPYDWRGHIGVVVEATSSYIKLFEQYQGIKAGIKTRYWTQDVKGWVRHKGNGVTTMEKMSDDTGRQVAYHILGRNGFDGRPNALATGSDQAGRPLTNAEMNSIFLSPESRNWRDIQLPQVYGERDKLRAEVTAKNSQIEGLLVQIDTLTKQLEEQAKTINEKQAEIDQLSDDVAKLTTDLEIANTHIKDLEAQLAVCGSQDVTINFNIFGNIFWALIKAFGTKSKGDK